MFVLRRTALAVLFLLGALGVVARKRSNLAERLNDLRDEFTRKMDSLQDELSDLRRLVRRAEAQPEPISAVVPTAEMRETTAAVAERSPSLQEPIVSPPEVVPATEEDKPIAPMLAAFSAETSEQIPPEVPA